MTCCFSRARLLLVTLVALAAVTLLLLAPGSVGRAEAAAPPLPTALALVPVDDPGPYQPQVSCDPVAKPGVVATGALVVASFGGRSGGIARSCATTGTSEHEEGRAWDWMVSAGSRQDRRRVAAAMRWLTAPGPGGEPAANARRLGVMYVIWNRRIWASYAADRGWRPYTGASAHRDHVHVSFTWNGAMKQTSWWTGAPAPTDFGPCQRWAGVLAPAWTAPTTQPCPAPLARPRADRRGVYRAQADETVERVAGFFATTVDRLRALNPWLAADQDAIPVGTKVRVRG